MKPLVLWILAIAITVSAAIYQRMTGPTQPKKTEISVDGTKYYVSLKRSQTNTRPCFIKLEVPEGITGNIFYKKYRVNEEWTCSPMTRMEGVLTGELPSQPAAGKLEYRIIIFTSSGEEISVTGDKPVVIRFKGNVPALVMIPHILIMFFAMLISNLAGLSAAFGAGRQKKYGQWALWLLIAGGMILGPIIQKYAFGELWTGVPFGWDLTDNKTLIAVVCWIIAVLMNRKKEKPAFTVAAAIILLIVYSIPHSMFGSELNYATGTLTQG